MKILKIIIIVIISHLCMNIVQSYAQQTTVQGRQAKRQTVYDDTIAVARTFVLLPSAGHSGWFRVDEYQFYSYWVEFDTTGFAAGIGLTSVDSVEISFEQYVDDVGPTSSSDGFVEFDRLVRDVIAIYDSTTIVANPKTFISFHGSGDPEIALGTYVRFYVRLVGGFTGAGLGLKTQLLMQP